MPLSARQMEYLCLAWLCFNEEPKVDLDKFATVAGLASANSARELLRVTKKKLKEEHGSLSAAVVAANSQNGGKKASATSTPAKGGKTTTVTTPVTMASTGKTTTATGKKRGRPAGSRKIATPAAAATATACAEGEGDGEGEALEDGEEAMDDDEEMMSPSNKRAKVKKGVKAAIMAAGNGRKRDHGVIVKAEPMNGDDGDEDGTEGLYGAAGSFETDFLL